MTRSVWQQATALPSPRQTDVAIVGAGIAGLSLAYWLRELKPQLRVSVLEAGPAVGSGASGKNAGFNTVGSTHYVSSLIEKHGVARARELWDFKQESLRLMREHLFTRFSVSQVFWGSHTLYRDPQILQQHAANLAGLGASNWQTQDGAALAAQGLAGFAGALSLVDDGALHSLQLLEALRGHLEERGVEFHFEQAVAWGEADPPGVRLQLARGELRCQQVFLALNGYAGQFHPQLAGWVAPKRAQMLSLEFAHRRLAGNFYDPPHKVYFRQHPSSGELLVGGMRLLDEAQENSDFDRVSAPIQQALQAYAEELFQEKLRVRARWAGIMGFTPEEQPYIRAVDFLPRTTFVGGFSGHGMGLAFGVAREAVLRL